MAKTHQTTITFQPAQGGALDGWNIDCADCGHVAGYSIESMTRSEADKHTSYMVKAGR